MTKAIVTIAACATLLCAAAASATATPQQLCDNARVTAWKVYHTCAAAALANIAKGTFVSDTWKTFARCRHAYFKKWVGFQTKAKLAGSTCVGARFTDNGNGTVTDNFSRLVWEKKTNDSSLHDKDNTYSVSSGPPYKDDGTVFSTFVSTLNTIGFAGSRGWRLPTLAELHTIVADFACTSGMYDGPKCFCTKNLFSDGCVEPALGVTLTQAGTYWSATPYLDAGTPNADDLLVDFDDGSVGFNGKSSSQYARAVRGGL